MYNLLPRVTLIVVTLLTLFVGTSWAQSTKLDVPRMISYQAQLLGQDGNLIKDGEYSITTKLYSDEYGDAVLWEDTYRVIVTKGIVSLMLGSGDVPLPQSSSLSKALWLGVSVNGSEEMRPLTPFSAVPYALNVANNSITAAKLNTDYLASLSVNGKKITGKGGKIDLYAGNGVRIHYDSISNQLMIMGSDATGSKDGDQVLATNFVVKGDLEVWEDAFLNTKSGRTEVRGDFEAEEDVRLNTDGGTTIVEGDFTAEDDVRLNANGGNTIVEGNLTAEEDVTVEDDLRVEDDFTAEDDVRLNTDGGSTIVEGTLRAEDDFTAEEDVRLNTDGGNTVVEGDLTGEEDLVIHDDVYLNTAGSGKTEIRGNVVLGSSSSKTIDVKGKLISDLDMNLYNIKNVDSLEIKGQLISDVDLNLNNLENVDTLVIGKPSVNSGAMQFVTEDKGHLFTIVADSSIANRTYRIPDVQQNSTFLMTSGVQTLDSVLFTHVLIPSNDNEYALGDETLRYKDIYMGPGSLHLIASLDDGVAEERDYAQQIDVTNGEGNGDLVFRESGLDLMRVSAAGDMTVTGATNTDGLNTSGNITPTEDNTVQIGSTDSRVADIYLGPGSLHLIASLDDGVAEEKDYAQQVDVTSGDGNGDLVFRESGADLFRIAPDGNVTVTGNTITDGVTTSGNITPTDDNSVQIGSNESRIADIYLGPGSLHLIASLDDGVAEEKDYAQQVDVTSGDGNGDLVFRESGADLMRIAPDGNVTVTGSTTTDGVTTSGNITPTTDNSVQIGSNESRIADIYLGPGSLHLIASLDDGVAEDKDYAQQVDVTDGPGNGDLVFRESGADLFRIGAAGDVTVSGSTTTDGVTTSGNITPTTDNSVQIGSNESRIADIYLGPGSLHLIASLDDGVAEDKDYAQQVDVTDGPGNGDLVFRESGADLFRIAPDGNVTVTGNTTTGGVTTSGNITPTTDNSVQIGSNESRIADIYLGPGSLHLIASLDDGVAEDKDYAQQVDVTDGPGNGDLVIRESGADLLRIAPTGDVIVSGSTTTGGVVTSGNVVPSTDNTITLGSTDSRYMDIFVGPGSIHVSGSSAELGGQPGRDWVLDLLQSGPNAGNFQILEGGNLALAIDPLGNAAITGKVSSALTTNDDAGSTLVTKSYVDEFSGSTRWSLTGNTGLGEGSFIGTTDANSFIVRTNNAERITVLSTGEVGIGNTNPLTALDVTGGFRVTGPATVVGTLNFDGALYGLGNGSVTGSFAVGTDVILGNDSTQGRVYLHDNNGAIGTLLTADLSGNHTYTLPNASGTIALLSDISAMPPAGWELDGNAGLSEGSFIGTTDMFDLSFRSNNIERMRLSGEGGVEFFDPLFVGTTGSLWGDGDDGTYLTIDGTDGGTTELQINGDATITGGILVSNAWVNSLSVALNASVYGSLNVAGVLDVNDSIFADNLSVAGGISAIYLASDLDATDRSITNLGSLTGGTITTTGTVSVGGQLKIQEPEGGESYTIFRGNPTQTEDIEYTMPAEQGNPGAVLQNDGEGGLAWGTHVRRVVVTEDVTSISANSETTFTFDVPGAQPGSAVFVSPEESMPGGVLIGLVRVSASDEVEVRIVNLSAAAVDLSEMDWYFGIIR